MITNSILRQLMGDMNQSLGRDGRRIDRSGRLLTLQESHVFVITGPEIRFIHLDQEGNFPIRLQGHSGFRGYFEGIPVLVKNDPMSWAQLIPEDLLDLDTLEPIRQDLKK